MSAPAIIPRRRRGFALLVVLFGLAVVTVLVAASIGRTAAHVKIARYAARQHVDAALLDGALTVAATVAAARPGAMAPEGVEVRIGDETVTVALWDVRGLVDVNTADRDLMAALFRAAGADGGAVADAVVAKRRRQQPWRTPAELVRLGLLDRAELARIRPYLTTHSRRRDVEAEVLPEELRALLGQRGYLIPPAIPKPSATGFFRATAQGTGFREVREVALSGRPDQPAQLLAID